MGKPPVVTGDPDTNQTIVCVSGTLEIDQQKVPVVAKTGDDLLVELTQPAKIGNALTVGTWLYKSWDTKVSALLVEPTKDFDDGTKPKSDYTQATVTDPAKVVKNLKDNNVPDKAAEFLSTLILTDISITDLYIRSWTPPGKATKSKAFKFGVKFDLTGDQKTKGLELLPGIALLDVGLVISNAPKDYVFPKHKTLPIVEGVETDELPVAGA